MNFIDQVADLFGSQDGHGDESGETRTPRSGLYRCPNCDTTYVSETMDSCPECREPVESIPDERDLGMA